MIINKDADKLSAVSLVDRPATEHNFVKLAKENIKLTTNEDKQEVTGVVLIPNQLIYRTDGENEYNIFLTDATIKQLSIDLFSNNLHNAVTLGHNTDTNATSLVESWIVENGENDKANELGLGVLPKGTLIQTRKINDLELWEEVKDGKYNGYSIEALLTPTEISEDEALLMFVLEILKS